MAIPALEIEITADPTQADVGFKKLERSLDGLEKATQDYNVALQRINKAEKAGIVTNKQARAAIKGAEQAYRSAAKAAASYSGAQVGFSRATGNFSDVLNKNSFAIQQAGYQVGDFAVQVGSGTSALTAFAQQGSQVLGVFGVWGAVGGAALAIAAPLALAFMDGAKGAKTLKENLDALAEAMDAVNSAQSEARTGIQDLRSEYGDYSDAVREVLVAQREIANIEALMALNDAIDNVSKSYGELEGTVSRYGFEVQNIEETTRDLAKQLDLSIPQAKALAEALREVGRAEGPENQIAAMRAAREQIELAAGGLSKMDDETREVYQSLLDAELAASRLAAIDAASNMEDAADEAARLANELDRAATNKRILSGASGVGRKDEVVLDPRDPRYDPIAAAMATMEYNTPGPGGGGGGKGGGGKGQPNRIGALAKSLMTEQETIDNWRTENLEKLADFNQLELDALGGHAEAKLRIEEEYQKRLGNLHQQERNTRLQAISGALGDVSSLMQSENKKIFNIGKAASMANAVVKGYEAAVEAWGFGMKIGGPPVAAAFTAASLAKTGMLINNIASQQVGGAATAGGGGGGGGGGGTSTVGAASSAPAQSVLDVRVTGVGPMDLFTGSQVSDLFEMLQKEAGDRGLGRVTFA